MSKYYCNYCDYDAKVKSSYDKHLKTKKHENKKLEYLGVNQKSTKSQPRVNQKSTKSQHFEDISQEDNFESKFKCKYCEKNFKFKQSMYKHIKYTCKKNKDEDFKELARLLNEKDKQIKELISDKNIQFQKMQKQIDKLINKLQIQNMNSGNINNGTINNNTMNIQLLNYKDTDYSHLTPKDYITCIQDCNHCVKTLIEKVHFNKDKPENMNIYLSNIKGKYVMIYKDNEWQIKDKKTQVDDLYEYNEFVLENWYDEYAEKYPNIVESFKKYLTNRDTNILLNEIKEEILVLLYNKRKMIANE